MKKQDGRVAKFMPRQDGRYTVLESLWIQSTSLQDKLAFNFAYEACNTPLKTVENGVVDITTT